MKRKAFTLIELLVVIGIITILIAMVVTVMNRAREYARSVKCFSNIKQVTTSLINYDTNNDSFPYSSFINQSDSSPPGEYIGNPVYDEIGLVWLNFLFNNSREEIIKNPILWCPSRRMTDRTFKGNVLVANYGVNQSICKSNIGIENFHEFTGSPLSGTNIRSASQTLLIVDSGYMTINWYHVTESPPEPLGKAMKERSYLPGLAMNGKRNLLKEQRDDAANARHINQSANIGFVDGHAKRKKVEDLHVEKTTEGYKNRSPLWTPQR